MKEVAVIGTGSSGLAAIRSLITCKEKVNITAYELSDRVGGLWVNRDPHKKTAMYEDLRANLVKDLIGYVNFPFPPGVKETFPSQEAVLEYIESYAKHFDMHQYIKFRHQVVEVDPFTSKTGEERWYVSVRNEETGVVMTRQFDAVMVCTGHESNPHIPDIDGVKTYTGDVMHSFYYQSPHYFSDRTVVVVGGSFSAIDILMKVQPVAEKIYFSHHNEMITSPLPEKTEHVPDISRINGADIILKDGRVIHADVIILATGYRYNFPFLSERCRPEIKENHIPNVYKMMVDIEHPSLYYIGFNTSSLLLRQAGIQSEWVAAYITGKISPVSKEDMQKEYADRYQSTVTDPGKRPNDFHHVLYSQWEYHKILAKESGCDNPQHLAAEKLALHQVENIFKCFERYRECEYKIVSDDDFEIVYEPPVSSN